MPWNEIIIAIAILTGLGLLFSVILAVANIKLKVYEDPRIDKVEEFLPGANCGACGMPGCRAFAEGVVKGELNPGKCTVSAPSGIERIADYLGVEASQEEKRVARVLCAGGKNEAHNRAHYRGTLSTCRGESVVAGGPKDCSWGCLGLGDCADVCDFDAILTTDRCSVACNACGRCAADAPPGLIEIRDGLARINYDLNHLAIPDATKRCPTGAIVWLDGEQQFALASEPELPLGRVDEPDYDQDTYYQ